MSQGDAASGPHVELALRPDGVPEFAVRTAGGVVRAAGPVKLTTKRWYLLVGGYSDDAGARLEVRPLDPLADEAHVVVTTPPAGPLVNGCAPMLFAARREGDVLGGYFDGKLDGPTVFTDLRTDTDWLAADTRSAWHLGARAHWELSHGIGGDRLLELVGGHHGTLHHHPRRGVTGHDWTGDVPDWRFADRGYAAVRFSSDDLADCGWEPVAELRLPDDLPSGCYAVQIASEGTQERAVPLFVRPPVGRRRAEVAWLAPTVSYLAASGENGSSRRPARWDDLLDDLRVLGLLGRATPFDVVTDHDLHAEGLSAIDGYQVVVTGQRPDHWTAAMLDAVDAYLRGGGRLVHLGDPDARRVAAIHPRQPHLVETRTAAAPGEHVLSTGEPGGLWRDRGRGWERLLGRDPQGTVTTPGGGVVALSSGDDIARTITDLLRRSSSKDTEGDHAAAP